MSRTIEQQLNALCARTTNPAKLNRLHACRDGHPLGKDNDWKWRNAWITTTQGDEFLGIDLRWLRMLAVAERDAWGKGSAQGELDL